ncbi:helix-turn-helix transcriptional regulator [Pedobacter hiemivivus]|jgi:transcriptional regulator with XRE-family HTH domain|uniref:Helix-turn-helix transcriptional regulator n=1 Tax=Pedobacter hiemivivus TaxID=2530454 RepID=A0A4R0MZJ6_9SPHI|nr:helix-turn-helix transcriptional regulator [Pedobacter hiemivivus]TCC92755.1 XRE family transcriptional regulator [Pedobacter hiemivivus]TKC56178.1 helix-turn-helix transcriptional regulator [Pedobacter hiemivivus]
MKTLGEKFRILRQKMGVNQKAMADQLEISIPAYSKLETSITDPNFSRINQIAKVHGLTLREFLDIGEEGASEQEQLIQQLKEKITTLENSVIRLQSKLIDLYDREDQKK